jgi:DnaK suppressor protein
MPGTQTVSDARAPEPHGGRRETLTARRRELERDITGRIRESRADRTHEVVDQAEGSDADIQEDLDLTVLQMRAEALAGIDSALARIDAGKFGLCVDCEERIPARRLVALPFAVRCRACEERHEHGLGRGRPLMGRRFDPEAM